MAEGILYGRSDRPCHSALLWLGLCSSVLWCGALCLKRTALGLFPAGADQISRRVAISRPAPRAGFLKTQGQHLFCFTTKPPIALGYIFFLNLTDK